ncbi:16S rRNA (cytosine(967)-C(5))-methyltransferase RsmB [Clostridium coskatii]|uniref:16S rRNA (cytosine(967)-C(5))-methyltransferase n=1 Tax=Clostridium coskatii TaxID=1705578 RepID=A0A166TYC2_9CLOT|nr:16S rRNA (cytosine(967)-C(5))-methyltransferase RsmB [Clostridium coskatii]OAA94348.1 Ribosomal RNA small subunit methyltransferase B [Clostridium coskatii]OBR93092.1 ribosomal RNA small subunit methyltransferase B [Clostridium coskatii]
MNGARSTAVEILNEVLESNAYSNKVLNTYLNKNNLNKKDKALVTEIVYGTLKYMYTIDTILDDFIKSSLKKMNIDIVNILRISIYQLRYLDKIPEFAVVNEAVELSKKKSKGLSKLVNGVLRNYLRNKDNLHCEHNDNKIDNLCFKYSFPRWMTLLFIHQYGEAVGESILQSLNYIPKVTVRVNGLKIDYKSVWDELLKNGYDIQKGKICKEAVVINRGSNIEENPLFKKGYITAQDESAMLVAHIVDPEENMTILDMCSAPGGKSCHMAELMKNTGVIYAYDLHENKLRFVEENANRMDIKNIKCNKLDAEKYVEQFEATADRVLIDVPCSGLGIVRKKPEIKWNKSMKSLNSLINVQRKIMLNASRYVKDGGKLIYSTCTLNKSENEDNINWFIRENPQYKLEKIYCGDFDNIIYHKEGYITILPDDNMDGFFIAKMIKHR